MRLARGPDDADVIRARLRALLSEGSGSGWLPEDARAVGGDPPAPAVRDPAEAADEDEGAPPPDQHPAAGRHPAAGPAGRVDPGRPGARALWVAPAVAVLPLLAVTWWDRPSVAPVPAAPASPTGTAPGTSAAASAEPTSSPAAVVVSVVGRVARPGLVTLPAGARVADAVEAAGGLLPGADQATVNLAAPLADGQQVAVGVPGATVPTDPGAGPSGAGGPVDLNSAGAAELEGLPGIGPVLAQRIVEQREQHGPFTAVDDLQDVPGIGPAVFDGLADAVTV